MNLTKYPQYQLYLFTMRMFMLKNQLIPKDCDDWCVNASIINRAYYSSYQYCLLWLKNIKKFEPKHPWEFKKNERKTGEHKQVRNALFDCGEEKTKTELTKLSKLRKKADYEPYSNISAEEVKNAIEHMKNIFNQLKFQ